MTKNVAGGEEESKGDLEIDVRASGEAAAELRVLLDGPPFAGAVLVHARAQRLLLLCRPLLLRSPHRVTFSPTSNHSPSTPQLFFT